MAKAALSKDQVSAVRKYVNETANPELINTYLRFIEKKFNLQPVLFPRDKKVYRSIEELVKKLEEEGRLWKETEIKIGFSRESVDENTKKIYICPFTGKVFGDNTHPNPLDAIYDWVSKCPENTERVGGLKVKRFYISEDPGVIQEYRVKTKPTKEPITKIVYTSTLNGKLFNTKESVVEDFKRHYVKKVGLIEVQNQNQFEIEEEFLTFLQGQLQEDKITEFVESLAEIEEFLPYIESWLESEE
ncbi:MAG: DUF2709 domain-containing protein [Chlamydiia bacterium]|nr:DUF2709 domain-containing protein [Chlamydiia bacterium]